MLSAVSEDAVCEVCITPESKALCTTSSVLTCVVCQLPQTQPAEEVSDVMLPQVDLSGLSREQLMALAINVYNAMLIHALVIHGTEHHKTAAGRLSFFTQVRLVIYHTVLLMLS